MQSIFSDWNHEVRGGGGGIFGRDRVPSSRGMTLVTVLVSGSTLVIPTSGTRHVSSSVAASVLFPFCLPKP